MGTFPEEGEVDTQEIRFWDFKLAFWQTSVNSQDTYLDKDSRMRNVDSPDLLPQHLYLHTGVVQADPYLSWIGMEYFSIAQRVFQIKQIYDTARDVKERLENANFLDLNMMKRKYDASVDKAAAHMLAFENELLESGANISHKQILDVIERIEENFREGYMPND
jgi:hypothetical protein